MGHGKAGEKVLGLFNQISKTDYVFITLIGLYP